MRRSRAAAVHATGDRVLSHGRRIICTAGLHGAKSWHVSDAASGVSGTQAKPTRTATRVAIRTPSISLTPGHFLRASIVALPSGETEVFNAGTGNWDPDGVFGQVQIAVSYNNGATTTVTEVIDLPGSKLANGAQPTGAGAAWANLITRLTSHILPADMSLPANLAAWSDGVSVSVVVAYVGSPRVVDLCVWEEPYAIAVDANTTDWPMPMHSNGAGGQSGQLSGKTPRTQRSGSDFGEGAAVVCDAAKRLCQELGPVLWFATAWDEDAQAVASTETDYRAISTVTPNFTELLTNSNLSTLGQGWSTASGANAVRIQDTIIKGANANKMHSIPVRFCVYGAMSTGAGPTATVRLETSSTEFVVIPVPTGTSYAWHEAPGYIRVGLGAQFPVVMHVRANVSSAAEFRWRYLAVIYAPGC